MGIRDSFVLTDGEMRVLAELIVLTLIANVTGVWLVLDGDVLHASILPASGLLAVFWFLVWAVDIRMLKEELHYYKDSIVLLSGIVSTGGFIAVTVATGSYGNESTACIVYNACIDHTFTVASGLAALVAAGTLFAITYYYMPRLLFPQMYETIRDTAFLAGWSTEEEEEEVQTGAMRMKTIKETGLDNVSLDEIVEYEELDRYHKFALPVLIVLASINAVIWGMIPDNLSAPYYLHLITVAVVFVHVIYITGPRMYAMFADSVVRRLRRVTYGSAVVDGVMAGILIGAILIHPDIPVTGALPRNGKMLLVIVLTIPTTAVMPLLLHFIFHEHRTDQQGQTHRR